MTLTGRGNLRPFGSEFDSNLRLLLLNRSLRFDEPVSALDASSAEASAARKTAFVAFARQLDHTRGKVSLDSFKLTRVKPPLLNAYTDTLV